VVSRPASDGGPLARGWSALASGGWGAARAAFGEALRDSPSAAAWEGMSWAAWWLEDAGACLEAREQAFRLYREAGDERGGARMALWIGDDHLEFHGASAVAEGWFGRAARLLSSVQPSAEHGWLTVFEAHSLLGAGDLAGAVKRAAEARELGSRCGAVDLEMFSLATEGHAMTEAGEVERGLRCLDEAAAAALAGEFGNLAPAAWTCCLIMSVCEQVRDFERGAQWCRKVEEFSVRMGARFLTGVCRAHYAAILTWRGNWAEAERELARSVGDLSDRRPYWRSEAVVRLADLRRRQGQLAEAEELYAAAAAHPMSAPGLGAVQLSRGEPGAAREVFERCLRRLGPDTRLRRAWLLEALVEAVIADGDPASAAAPARELRAIAAEVGTPALRAAARHCDGLLAAATADHAAARHHLEDAVDLLETCRTPVECARARLDLAGTLLALGHEGPARREASAALAGAQEVGATAERDRARDLLSAIGSPGSGPGGSGPGGSRPAGPLTARQLDVLRLVAEGLGDKEIAVRLVLSEHTVHRHLANIYTRLGCPTRAAAVALAARLGLL
jgi:ATP/maltotriose-dependent transcriptional regulator MalT